MIESTRHLRHRLILHRGSGPVTGAEIRDAVEASHCEPVLPLEIWDFSTAEVESLGIEELGSLLGQIYGMVPGLEGERTALVVSHDGQREMAELFRRLADFQEFPVELRSFPDLASAAHWLLGPSAREFLEDMQGEG